MPPKFLAKVQWGKKRWIALGKMRANACEIVGNIYETPELLTNN